MTIHFALDSNGNCQSVNELFHEMWYSCRWQFERNYLCSVQHQMDIRRCCHKLLFYGKYVDHYRRWLVSRHTRPRVYRWCAENWQTDCPRSLNAQSIRRCTNHFHLQTTRSAHHPSNYYTHKPRSVRIRNREREKERTCRALLTIQKNSVNMKKS